MATYTRMNLDPSLKAYTKINFKWAKDPRIRTKTTKLVEKKHGKISCY
jgi:hypothetical protein